MDFLIGFCGALAVLLIFALGVLAGWKLRIYLHQKFNARTAEEITEAEKKRLEEEQQAFDRMYKYNVNDAYGMNNTGLGGE